VGDKITISNPRGQRPLAVHTELSSEDAQELISIYCALGYPDHAIEWIGDEEETAA
jgi:hypothetical protein